MFERGCLWPSSSPTGPARRWAWRPRTESRASWSTGGTSAASARTSTGRLTRRRSPTPWWPTIDLVAMAGFGTVLTEAVHDAFPGRILNTHPALLPAFPGWHGVRDALEAGVKVTGCTVHLATLEMDAGPILAQEAVPVRAGDTVETLHERIKVVERGSVPRHRGLGLGGAGGRTRSNHRRRPDRPRPSRKSAAGSRREMTS